MTDEDLMLQFAQGDRSAFARLIEKHKARVVEFATQIVKSREAADDIGQDAFLRVFRARESYRPTARFSTWLYTIATNLCYDELRKHRRQVSLEGMLGHPPNADEQLLAAARHGRTTPAGPDVQAERRELSGMIDETIRSLSREHREVITLRIHEGLGYAEVAERLDCSLGTAKSRMHYAMKKLRERMLGKE